MPFKFLKARFNGDPNIGLYGFAADEYCLLGFEPQKILDKMENALGVKARVATIAGTELIGLFAAGNKSGIIVPKIIEDYELKQLKKLFGINVSVIEAKDTALGNMVVCNDNGCVIPDKLKRYKRDIEDALNCYVQIGSIAGLDTIGSVAVANNKGCLCHPDASSEEIKMLGDVLRVKVDVGTAGFGSPFIKSGIIVNSEGIVFSELSTGPEIGRFEEVFS
jgi:translation initiation factor 6